LYYSKKSVLTEISVLQEEFRVGVMAGVVAGVVATSWSSGGTVELEARGTEIVDLIKENQLSLRDQRRRSSLEVPGFSELGKSVLTSLCIERRNAVLQ